MKKKLFQDPVLNALVKKYPPPKYTDRTEQLFERIIDAIISQQLSVKAADTIFKRFLELFKSKSFPTPKEVAQINDWRIRKAGISRQKISYIKHVAQEFYDGNINAEKIKKMSDEDAVAHLTKLRGVGKWTAEMLLIGTFARPDIFSLGDAGLRRAITNLYKITNEQAMLKLSEKWKPYRSFACWYLWRSLENE